MKGKLYEESKRDNKCEICGELIPRGTPVYLQMIDGNWTGWCPKHGPAPGNPAGAPETALEGTEDLKRIADSLDALLTGISKDFELSRLDARGIYDELKGIKIVLEQLKMQGAK
jgi:hypothetical protein